MAFDQALPHTCRAIHFLESVHLRILRWRRLQITVSSSLLRCGDGNKAALTPVSGPQRRREEVILNFGTYPAVTHYLIISHLLVAKEKVKKKMRAVTQVYVGARWVFELFAVLQIQWNFMPESNSTTSEWEGNSTNLWMHTIQSIF